MNITGLYKFNNIQEYSASGTSSVYSPLVYKYNLNCDTVNFKNRNADKYNGLAILNQLYTPEYTISPKKNKDGYYRTTLIDLNHDKPVVVYLKPTHEGGLENYNFYEKNIFGNYKKIGKCALFVDNNNRLIDVGYMESDCRGKYAGVGARGHQLAVEHLIKSGFDKITLLSYPDAFEYHYRCGFRPYEKQTDPPFEFDGTDIKDVNKYFCGDYILPEKLLKSVVVGKDEKEGKLLINDQVLTGKIFEHQLLNGRMLTQTLIPPMMLTGEALEKWKDRAEMQPITLGV